MSAITIIELTIFPAECGICGSKWDESPSETSYGVMRYEDLAVPDNYDGLCGGMQVCRDCFEVERELRKLWPHRMIPFGEILLAPRVTQ